MRSKAALLGVFVLGILVALVAMTTVRAQEANPTVVQTNGGLTVEQVRVGSSCSVVVSRTGSGPSDPVAVAPCR